MKRSIAISNLMICLLLVVCACAAPVQTVIKSSVGDLRLVKTQLVQEVHSNTPPEGYTILLISLAKADGSDFPVDQLQKAQTDGMVVIVGDDGAPYACTMGGMLEDGSMALGCPVPSSLTRCNLSWDGNPSIEIDLSSR